MLTLFRSERYAEVVQELCFANLPTHPRVRCKIFRLMAPFDGVLLSVFVLYVLVHINANACAQKLLLRVGCFF